MATWFSPMDPILRKVNSKFGVILSMSGSNSTIKTIQPGGKLGQSMEKDSYEIIKSYMLKILDHGNALDINTFINLSHEKFEPIYKASAGMMIYAVKRDLEARGLIYHEYATRKVSSTRLAQSHGDKTESHGNNEVLFTKTPLKVNQAVYEKFTELFTKAPLIVQAPGRINLMGDHTDYNGGLVMPLTINKNVQVALAISTNSNSIIYCNRFNQLLSIDTRLPIKRIKNSKWQNYLVGVLAKLQINGCKVGAFNCVFDGDLPIGSGLASSAALACAFIIGLNELFRLKLTETEMIEIVHWSENNFVKVKCGIMDPFVSVRGREGKIVYLDCQNQAFDYLDLNLDGHCLLLCDTNIKHSHPISIYNKRYEECNIALQRIKSKFLELRSLRDISASMLQACQKQLPAKLFNRCKFVIEENARVELAKSCLISGDYIKLGKVMFQSHEGLSTFFEVSCDELDFLNELAKQHDGVLGSRMMGGGFGGCTLNLISNEAVGQFIEFAQSAYKQKFNMGLQCYLAQPGDGASLLQKPAQNKLVVGQLSPH